MLCNTEYAAAFVTTLLLPRFREREIANKIRPAVLCGMPAHHSLEESYAIDLSEEKGNLLIATEVS